MKRSRRTVAYSWLSSTSWTSWSFLVGSKLLRKGLRALRKTHTKSNLSISQRDVPCGLSSVAFNPCARSNFCTPCRTLPLEESCLQVHFRSRPFPLLIFSDARSSLSLLRNHLAQAGASFSGHPGLERFKRQLKGKQPPHFPCECLATVSRSRREPFFLALGELPSAAI